MNHKDLIFKIIEELGLTRAISKISKNAALREFLKAETSQYSPTSISEQLYIFSNRPPKKLQCGKYPKFNTINTGYRQFCGPTGKCECARIAVSQKVSQSKQSISSVAKDAIQRKREQTNLEKYGVTNCGQTQKAQEGLSEFFNNADNVDCVVKKRKQTNLERYGGHPARLPETQVKRVETTLKRYGVSNVSHLPEVRHKMKDTTMKRYGVPHATMSAEIKDKICQTNLERYGGHPSKLPETTMKKNETNIKRNTEKYGVISTDTESIVLTPLQAKIPTEVFKQFNSANWWAGIKSFSAVKAEFDNVVSHTFIRAHAQKFAPHILISEKITTPHQKIIDIIPAGINYTINDRSVINPYELDIYFPDHNFAVEINGTYWHSEVAGNKDRNYHIHKFNACNQKNIDLYQFWDFEIYNQFDIVKSMIENKLGISTRIFARKTKVRYSTNSNKFQQFFNENHMQGHVGSSFILFLEYNDDVVAVASFGKPRYRKDVDYELLRFATKKGYTIVGGFSKILNHLSESTIVSYANKRWSRGNVYEKNGFKLDTVGTPAYYYTNDYSTLHNRVQFQKHKLSGLLENFNPAASEWENMKANNWDRVWDCGSDTYIRRPEITTSESEK